MFAARSTHSRAGLWLATMLAAVTWPSLGHAYTAEEQQACSGDAFRLCSAEIPEHQAGFGAQRHRRQVEKAQEASQAWRYLKANAPALRAGPSCSPAHATLCFKGFRKRPVDANAFEG